jgi:hypothetical protein
MQMQGLKSLRNKLEIYPGDTKWCYENVCCFISCSVERIRGKNLELFVLEGLPSEPEEHMT